MPHALTHLDLLASFREAFGLLATRSLRWFLALLVFVVGIEALGWIPYAGFALKLVVAGLLLPQWLLLLAEPSPSGRMPVLRTLARGFTRSPVEASLLIGASLAPGIAGVAFLAVTAESVDELQFFLGHAVGNIPLHAGRQLGAGIAAGLFALPFAFLPASIALYRQHGIVALYEGLSAAARNWGALSLFLLPVVAYAAVGVSFQFVEPGSIAMAGLIALQAAIAAWTLAFVYAVSIKALGLQKPRRKAFRNSRQTAAT